MMNIIISSLNTDGMKVVGTGTTDIDYAKLFVANELNVIPTKIELFFEDIFYSLAIVSSNTLNKENFKGYRLLSKTSIPLHEYQVKVYFTTLAKSSIDPVAFTEVLAINNGLVDEHEPIYINGRQINPITTPIVAGDKKSQQISFYIKKCYDGISFLDDSKRIGVDYIPVDRSDLVPGQEFNTSYDIEILDDPDPAEQEGDWLLLKWDVPDEVMKTQGTVQFGIAVLNSQVDAGESTEDYCWQTFPSSFIVSKYLGVRKGYSTSSPEESSAYTQLANKVSKLISEVDAIQSMDLDNDDSNNEFIIGGGDAAYAQANESEAITND